MAAQAAALDCPAQAAPPAREVRREMRAIYLQAADIRVRTVP
jgi:hypothetical protein